MLQIAIVACYNYCDDILIVNNTEEEHHKMLKQMLERLEEVWIKLKWKQVDITISKNQALQT